MRSLATLVSTLLVSLVLMQTTCIAQFCDIEEQLVEAGKNRGELETAVDQADGEQRKVVEFLIKNMPVNDLQTLTADFLLTDAKLAAQCRQGLPWELPEEIFLNYVAPYANVDETREPWRAKLAEICKPMVKGCKTPAEAAQKLNQLLYQKTKVKYSTKRKKANQSPSETMEQGLASCTGLSILLVDACRSVGVPARLAGIPKWANKNGNHTWVEIWSEGKWYFTGAAEYNAQGLNRTWFQADAALAKKDSRLSAIYAVSFEKTNIVFPMVWSRGTRPVYAINVTDRYTPKTEGKDSSKVRVMIRVWNADRSERLVADVTMQNKDDKSDQQQGQSKAGTADMNDMLSFKVKSNGRYTIKVHENQKLIAEREFESGTKPQQVIELKADR